MVDEIKNEGIDIYLSINVPEFNPNNGFFTDSNEFFKMRKNIN